MHQATDSGPENGSTVSQALVSDTVPGNTSVVEEPGVR